MFTTLSQSTPVILLKSIGLILAVSIYENVSSKNVFNFIKLTYIKQEVK